MNEDDQEREWLAQERAMSREGSTAHEDYARATSYGRIARALRERRPDCLPPDFARRVAARAAATDEAPFESTLVAVLVATLGICAAVIVDRFGSQWIPDSRAGGWLLAFAGCLGASWVMEKWRRWVP